MKYPEALKIAEKYARQLLEYCDRVAIAGSIRRKKPQVKDIEIVAIPWGSKAFEIKKWLAQFQKIKGEFPCKYTQRVLSEGINLDLFFATEDNWGLIYAIRTGPAEFSHKVLASGWAKKGYKSKDGILHHYNEDGEEDEIKYIRQEKELFDLIGIDFIEPEAR